jgi:GxxExxY protein
MGRLIYPDLSYTINGVLFKIHNQLGRFRTEKDYGDAIETELRNKKIIYEREKRLPASFTGEKEGRHRIDFLIENKIILEIKTKRFLTREDYYQTRRYLSVLRIKLGLLVNFQSKYLKIKRIINSEISE